MTFAAIYAIVVGLGMIGQWAMSFATKQIPELETEPYRIWFHIVGEFITAAFLIAGGVGLLAGLSWARSLYLAAMGMLLYTAIVSPGYFAQKRQWPLVGMFAVILVLAVVSLVLVA